MMGQLVHAAPPGPLLRDRLLETVLGALVGAVVLLLVPDSSRTGRGWSPRRGGGSRRRHHGCEVWEKCRCGWVPAGPIVEWSAEGPPPFLTQEHVMSTRLRFVAVVAAAALTLPAVSVTAGSAAGMPLPDPRPHLHLLVPQLDANSAVLAELKDEYAATHLSRVHNAIVLILNSPASAVL